MNHLQKAHDNTKRQPVLLFFLSILFFPVAVTGAQLETYSTDTGLTFILPDLQGRERQLSDYRGKVVLVNFWASWCPPCIYEMPGLVRLKQRHADQPFEILALNVGEKKYRVWKFVDMVDFKLPVLLDKSRQVFQAWGLEILPTSFLLDTEGRVRYRVLGSPDWDHAEIDAMIEALMPEADGAAAN
jgi:thiol-disulfide isomerase/thioredoxin